MPTVRYSVAVIPSLPPETWIANGPSARSVDSASASTVVVTSRTAAVTVVVGRDIVSTVVISTVVADVTDNVTVSIAIGVASVVVVPTIPIHEHALAYLAKLEQADAYPGRSMQRRSPAAFRTGMGSW